MQPAKKLLALVEFLGQHNLRPVYERLGFQVGMEWTARKAIALARKTRPDVVVADFYYQPDFRDRVSNLESLLATVQGKGECRVLVFYDAAHQTALDKLKERFRIDAAITLPIKETAVEDVLSKWC